MIPQNQNYSHPSSENDRLEIAEKMVKSEMQRLRSELEAVQEKIDNLSMAVAHIREVKNNA